MDHITEPDTDSEREPGAPIRMYQDEVEDDRAPAARWQTGNVRNGTARPRFAFCARCESEARGSIPSRFDCLCSGLGLSLAVPRSVELLSQPVTAYGLDADDPNPTQTPMHPARAASQQPSRESNHARPQPAPPAPAPARTPPADTHPGPSSTSVRPAVVLLHGAQDDIIVIMRRARIRRSPRVRLSVYPPSQPQSRDLWHWAPVDDDDDDDDDMMISGAQPEPIPGFLDPDPAFKPRASRTRTPGQDTHGDPETLRVQPGREEPLGRASAL
ncbi:hypothetical protein C8Q80DRAFT_1357899 [Daedaleopsis nitida]|nr:hypothetical protein C8Q80DRAFT_1357899 [Daedaleopsis nitida]